MEFPVLQFVPIDPCPVTGHRWLCRFLLYSIRYLWTVTRSPCTVSCLSRNSSSSHSFSLYEKCSGALVIFVSLFWINSNMSISFQYWKANTWTTAKKAKSILFHHCWPERKIQLLQPVGDSLPNVADTGGYWCLLWGLIAGSWSFWVYQVSQASFLLHEFLPTTPN